jgi:DNA-binding IclR family transcriptional regulator
MSVAVRQFKNVMNVITATAEGATASEVAASLRMGRQAAVRLLDAMVREGIAYKDPGLKRYRVALLVYEWGSRAVEPRMPSPIVRQEIASLAEALQVSMFYTVLEDTLAIALERTDKIGSLLVTVPHYSHRGGPFHWSGAPWGKLLAAFARPEEQERLLMLEGSEFNAGAADVESLRQELKVIRQQRYAAEALEEDRFAVAAPVLDKSGRCLGCVVGVAVEFSLERKDDLIRQLTDAVSRASYYAGYSPALLAR